MMIVSKRSSRAAASSSAPVSFPSEISSSRAITSPLNVATEHSRSSPRAGIRCGARLEAAAAAGLGNIAFKHGGFLSYQHEGPPADIVTSKFALHHLPDFWKAVALARIHAWLRPGGIFFLRDVVFSFAAGDCARGVEDWIG